MVGTRPIKSTICESGGTGTIPECPSGWRCESRGDRGHVGQRRGAVYASSRRRLLDRLRRANSGASAQPRTRARESAGGRVAKRTRLTTTARPISSFHLLRLRKSRRTTTPSSRIGDASCAIRTTCGCRSEAEEALLPASPWTSTSTQHHRPRLPHRRDEPSVRDAETSAVRC
jgi:hypothetical protein